MEHSGRGFPIFPGQIGPSVKIFSVDLHDSCFHCKAMLPTELVGVVSYGALASKPRSTNHAYGKHLLLRSRIYFPPLGQNMQGSVFHIRKEP
jgi:hypothetical protein